jgi:DNA-binding NtrC family response regulator
MRAGAYDYLKKDPQVDPEEIQLRIERLLEARGGRERDQLRGEVERAADRARRVVGASEALAHATALAKKSRRPIRPS